MKNNWILSFLLGIALLGSSVTAQTAEQSTRIAMNDSVVAAHCQYAPADVACFDLTGPERTAIPTNALDDNTIAQYPRQMPAPPRGPRPMMGYPRGGYYYTGMPAPNGRHATIGAVIGFGLGAAVGSKASDARTTLTLGAVGGLIGAAFGLATPSFPSWRPYWRGPWPDDDDEYGSQKAPTKHGRTSVAQGRRTERHTAAGPESSATLVVTLPRAAEAPQNHAICFDPRNPQPARQHLIKRKIHAWLPR